MTPRSEDTVTPRRRLQLHVPEETYQRLRREAFEGATTISALVNAALHDQPAPARIDAPPAPPIPADDDAEQSTVARVMARRSP